jgi:hypothetical protein
MGWTCIIHTDEGEDLGASSLTILVAGMMINDLNSTMKFERIWPYPIGFW